MLKYVPEAAEPFLQTWRIVRKEASLLSRTRERLFSRSIDPEWVATLADNDALGEQVEAFASRYSRLQDTMGEKLFPRLLELVGQRPKSLIDTLNQIERLGFLPNAKDWLTWRNLRNSLIHEYVEDPVAFADALNAANRFSGCLLAVVDSVEPWVDALGLKPTEANPPQLPEARN